MEILDSAYPLVQTVTTSIDPAVAFKVESLIKSGE
jgi:hypothetical protein